MMVGVTGHQNLGDAEAWCRTVVQDLVRSLPATHGHTCLAAGADQLFADILLDLQLPFTVVIPSQHYERAFSSKAARNHYHGLLGKAAGRILLPFEEPGPDAYLAAGERVVACVETLLAIWDGKAAKGLGGTADVVAYAREQGVAVVHCDPALRTVTWLRVGESRRM